MISKKVKVELYRPKNEEYSEDRGFYWVFENWTDDFDIASAAEDYITRIWVFEKFTNKGKLSKSDKNYMSSIAKFAENAFSNLIKLENETATDMERALKLKEIIDSADFDGELAVIKNKVSNSKWYDNSGFGHMRSQYETLVPKEVLSEALELQAIRKKHEKNQLFDFYKTGYKVVEKRIADHDNYSSI